MLTNDDRYREEDLPLIYKPYRSVFLEIEAKELLVYSGIDYIIKTTSRLSYRPIYNLSAAELAALR